MEAAGALLAFLILGAIIAFPIYVLVRLSDHTRQLDALRRDLATLRRPREGAPAMPPAERPQVAPAAPQQPVPPPPPPVIPRPAPVPPPAPAPVRAAAGAQAHAPTRPAAPPPPPSRPPSGAIPAPGAPRSFDFEAVVGANWLAKLGVIAIAVAAAFFLKYAIDVGWIGATARVALGLATAALMLGLGQWLLAKPRYRTYAQALASGGIVILFLSVYAAYNYYDLIGFTAAFAVLAAAALAASLLALSNDTQAVAMLCLLGAFATPLLIRQGAPGPGDLTQLYAYLVGLNLWTIVLVRLRPWHSLLVLSFGATWLIFFGAGQLDRGHYWVVEGFAALFLLFSFLGGRRFAGERTEAGSASPGAGVAIILLGLLAFVVASGYALAGVALFGLPALAAVGVAIAVALVAAPFALGDLREAGPAVAALLRVLSSVALLGLVAITISASPAVTLRQAPAAFVFTVVSYLLFLGIALHMQRQPAGEQPAIGLVLVNALTHAVSAAHALAPLRLFGLPTLLFWLPVAGWVGLAALPLARRREESVSWLSAALMSVAAILPLVSLLGLWVGEPFRGKVLPPLAVFGGEFVLLSASWVALRRAARGRNLRGDVLGQLATVAVFFALFAALAWGRTWEGLSLLCGCALTLALYYAVVGSMILVREDDDTLRRLTYLGLALTFATIAIPLQLRATALTVAWAAESAVLVWTGVVVQQRRLRWYGLALLAITTAKTLGLDLPDVTATRFLLNPAFLSGLAVSLAAYLSAFVLWRRRAALSVGERALPVSAVLVGSALAVIFLSAELWFTTGVHWSVAGRESAQAFALTLLWSVAAVAAMGAGTRYRSIPVQVLGGVLLSLALTKALFVDITFPVSPFHVLVNTRSGAAAAVIAALYFTAAALRSQGEGGAPGLKGLRAAMLATASLLTLIFGSLDLWERAAGQFSAQQLSLSIFWSCYALVVFSVGIALRLRAVRLSAMGLLYLSVLKVFLLDLNSLDTPYRIISFLGLGLILLLVSLLYHRFEERLR